MSPFQSSPETAHPGTAVENLAVEFLDRVASGERPDRKDFVARLSSPEERDEFLEILKFAVTVESCVPRVFEPGQQFGPYELLEEVGKGGMGRVFRARDTHLDREVAIKLLKTEQQGNETLRRRIEQEARTLARVHHPHIVGIHDAGSVEGIPYLVMDLIKGKTLRQVIETLGKNPPRSLKGRDLENALGLEVSGSQENLFDEDDYYKSVARIDLRVVRAIAAAHECGVLHRDLKPGNVMLCSGGYPVVMDFGLAGFQDQATGTVTESLFGTACYLAPEQFRNLKVGSDVLTDVYQLGLILYETLALRQAFPSDSVSKIAELVTSARYPLPRSLLPDTPRDLEAICLKAMDPDPGRRYHSAVEMAEDLERFLCDQPTKARPPGALGIAWRAARRHRSVIVSSILAVTAAVCLWIAFKPSDSSWGEWPVRRVSPVDGMAHPLSDGGTIYPGDTIVCDVEPAEPVTVWAVALLGRRGSVPETIRAVSFEPDREPADLRQYSRKLAEAQRLLLFKVPQSPPEFHDQLGLGLIKATGSDRVIEEWICWIAHTSRPEEEVSFEDACRRLADLVEQAGSASRGGPHSFFDGLKDMDREELKRILTAPTVEQRYLPLDFDGLECTELYFVLSPLQPGKGD